eukprot:2152476-Rhodomonas_salina.3
MFLSGRVRCPARGSESFRTQASNVICPSSCRSSGFPRLIYPDVPSKSTARVPSLASSSMLMRRLESKISEKGKGFLNNRFQPKTQQNSVPESNGIRRHAGGVIVARNPSHDPPATVQRLPGGGASVFRRGYGGPSLTQGLHHHESDHCRTVTGLRGTVPGPGTDRRRGRPHESGRSP